MVVDTGTFCSARIFTLILNEVVAQIQTDQLRCAVG